MSARWRLIASAPKSRTDLSVIPILAFCPDEYHDDISDERYRIAWWMTDRDGGRWWDYRMTPGLPKPPSHWQPLPKPPFPFA